MLKVSCIGRAVAWLAIGTFFGLASAVLIFWASVIFGHNFVDTHHVSTKEGVIFLSLALMSGAGADLLFSEIGHWGVRVALMFFVGFVLGIVYLMFSPNNTYRVNDVVINYAAWGIGTLTVIYCLSIKTVIFYKERVTNKELRKHTNKN